MAIYPGVTGRGRDERAGPRPDPATRDHAAAAVGQPSSPTQERTAMTTTDHAQATSPGTDRLITPEEVATILGGGNITAATVKHRWKHWGLHAHHIGKFLRFRESDVHAYVNSTTGQPAPTH